MRPLGGCSSRVVALRHLHCDACRDVQVARTLEYLCGGSGGGDADDAAAAGAAADGAAGSDGNPLAREGAALVTELVAELSQQMVDLDEAFSPAAPVDCLRLAPRLHVCVVRSVGRSVGRRSVCHFAPVSLAG